MPPQPMEGNHKFVGDQALQCKTPAIYFLFDFPSSPLVLGARARACVQTLTPPLGYLTHFLVGLDTHSTVRPTV